MAKFIQPILKDCVQCTHTVKNANVVKASLQNCIVPEGGTLVSFDVEKLYPSISQDLILESFKEILNKPCNASKLRGLKADQILHIIQVIFKTTYVSYQGCFFEQSGGVPAGCPLSSYITDGVLNILDERIVHDFDEVILRWFRYMDDIYAALRKAEKVIDIHQSLNGFHPSLKFTVELEESANLQGMGPSLPFLDLLIVRTQQGCISKHYEKPSQTNRTLHFTSAHPPSTLRAILFNEVNRAFEHCTLKSDRHNQALRIVHKYTCNGYPLEWIQTAIRKWRPNHIPQESNVREREGITWIKIPYIPKVDRVLKKAINGPGIKLTNSVSKTIGSSMQKNREQKSISREQNGSPSPEEKDKYSCKGVVYAVPCKGCHNVYVGQTGRKLQSRIKEHKRAVDNKVKSNAIAKHFIEEAHSPAFENTKIVHVETNPSRRLALEGYTIAANHSRLTNISPPSAHMLLWAKLWHDLFVYPV